MADENIRVVIEGDATDLRAALAGAAADLKGFGAVANSEGRRISLLSSVMAQQQRNVEALARSLKYAALGLGALGGYGAIKAIETGIKLNASWESAAAGIATFTGSVKSAEKFIERLRKVSAESPLRLTDYEEAARQLMGFGVQVDKVIPLLDAVNKAIVATGGGSEEMQRVVLALGQIQARGKASAEELNQLAEVGVPVNKILQKELGLTGEQVANIGNEGIKANEVLQAIADGWNKRYAEAYKNASDTFNFQMSRLQKQGEQLLRVATEPLFASLRDEWIPALNDAAEEIIGIWEKPGLTPGEKFEQSFETLKRDLGPLIDDLGDEISDLNLDEKFADVLDTLIPLAAEGFGKLAITAAESFAGAFIHADVWTKIVMGSWLFTKIAGGAGWVALGKKAGGLFGRGVEESAATTVASGGAGAEAGLLARFFGGPAALAALPVAMTALVTGLDAMQKTRLEGLSDDLNGVLDGLDGIGQKAGSVKDQVSGLDDQLKSAAEHMRGMDLTDGGTISGGVRGGIPINLDKTAADKVKGIIDQLKDKFGSLQVAARNMSGKSRQAFREFALAARQSGAITYDEWAKLERTFSNVTQKIENNAKQAAKVTGENWRDIAKATQGMRVSVAKDYDGMVNAVGGGLQILTSNTQKALAAVGLKQELKWQVTRSDGAGGIQGHPQARGGLLGLAGGGMVRVPGTGLEDKVPLVANGSMNVVAPGEDVAVFNRHQRPMIDAAVSAAYGVGGLKGFFSRFDRPHYMAGGGIVPVPGFPGEQANAAIIPALESYVKRFRLFLTDAYGPGHASPEHTQYGTAADFVPGSGGSWGLVTQAAYQAVKDGYNPVGYDGSGGTMGWPNHGPGNHVHITFLTAAELLSGQKLSGAMGGGIPGAVAEKIKRVVLNGPKGPLTEGGQAALDKVWHQANKMIAEQAGAAGGSGYVSGGNGAVAAQMGRILLKTGWNRTGAAGVIGNAYRESLWNPASVGTGGGGLFGFTTPPISLADLQSFAKSQGKPWTDVALQMQFMQNHLSGSVKQATMGAGSPEAAAERFMTLWERPGIPALSERQAAARRAFEMKSWARGGFMKPSTGAGSASPTPPTGHVSEGHEPRHGDRLPHLDVKHLIRRVGKADRKTQAKMLRAFGEKVDKFSLDKDLKQKIKRTTADFDDYYEAAGFAGQLSGDGYLGKYRGHTEAEWLKKALPKLAKLRNLLLSADNHLDRMRKSLEAQQKAARAELQRIAKKLKKVDAERRALDKKGAQKGKDGKPVGLSKQDKKHLDNLDAESRKLTARQRVVKDRLIPELSDQVRSIAGQDRTMIDSLVTVQGRSGSMKKLRSLPDPPPWQFGGNIFDVQSRLKSLGEAGGTNDAEIATLLREELTEARQTAALSQAQFGVFQGFFDELRGQMPYIGAFAHGTGGKQVGMTGFARVHKDEVIFKDPEGPFFNTAATQQAAPPQVTLIAEGDLGPLLGKVRAEIDGRAAPVVSRKVGRSSRQLSVAPGR